LVTGEDGPIARLHPVIKGVRGAQSSGASLVSFNIAAATSYGKDQSFNAPVGEAAAFGYATALNHLLRPETGQSLTMGDTTVVLWAERASPAETFIPALVDPSMTEWERLGREAGDDDQEETRAARLLAMLEAMRKGRPVTDPDLLEDRSVAFHVLGLAPNAARLSVRFWDVAPVAEMLRRLGEHHHDLALEVDYPSRPPSPSLWILAQETRPKDKEGKARGAHSLDGLRKLHGDIARAVLTGQPYPRTLSALLLARFRADGHVTHPRVALLKAEFNRRQRIAGHLEEMIPMALDPDRADVGYRLGRLFSVLERLQEAAHGGSVNAGVGQKFLSSASATPRAVFPHLLRLKGAHMKKVAREGKGLARWYENWVSEILDAVEDIPATLSPDQQGLFFLGYYHQRQALFRKGGKETDPASTEDKADTAA
jgi:CRISPR-associated protein Csd1